MKCGLSAGFSVDDLDELERSAAAIVFSEFEGSVYDYERNEWKKPNG